MFHKFQRILYKLQHTVYGNKWIKTYDGCTFSFLDLSLKKWSTSGLDQSFDKVPHLHLIAKHQAHSVSGLVSDWIKAHGCLEA